MVGDTKHTSRLPAGIKGRALFSRLIMCKGIPLPSQESYVKGSVILEKGSSGNYFYILLDGAISVHQNEEIIAEVSSESSANYFGITSALKPGSPRTTSVVAASNVHLLRLPTQTIRNLFNEDMAIRYNLTVTLDSRLRLKK